MSTPDNITIDRLGVIISQEVIRVLGEQPGASPELGKDPCAPKSPAKIETAVQAGAERLPASLGMSGVKPEVAHLLDHTLLKPEATVPEITQLCQEARLYNFASVCINPTHARLAAQLLQGSEVKVCTVVGFPLGATPTAVKIFETQQALNDGAQEIDMVINIGALKGGDDVLVERDIAGVVQTAHRGKALVKVIIETALLTDDEKIRACQLAKQAGADFVKTSTGFSRAGATVEDVALMRRTVGPGMGVKAAGGIRTLADAEQMIIAGATRLGVSAGVKIVREAQTL